MKGRRTTENGSRVTKRVMSAICSLIENDGLQPGSRIPSERELATSLRVGRPAVREAVKALSILDVVESRHGGGTFVKSLVALEGGWSVDPEHLQMNFDMLHLLEIRKMLEPEAASKAATTATPAQIRCVEEIMHELESNSTDLAKVGDADYLFHEAILLAASNPILTRVTTMLAPMLKKSREITAQNAPDMSRMNQEHRAILEAIRCRQADLAHKAMLDHLRTVGLDLLAARTKGGSAK